MRVDSTTRFSLWLEYTSLPKTVSTPDRTRGALKLGVCGNTVWYVVF
jgi:hypothetical protein